MRQIHKPTILITDLNNMILEVECFHLLLKETVL